MTHVHPYWKWLRYRKFIVHNRLFFATGVNVTFVPPHNKANHVMVHVFASRRGKVVMDQDMRIEDVENDTLQTLLMLVAGDG
jgi:hypothetical protein